MLDTAKTWVLLPRLGFLGLSGRIQFSTHQMELFVKVHQIILMLWVVVFAFWAVRQFAEHNKRTDK